MKWKEYSLDELIHIKHGYAFKGEFFSEEPTDDILLTPGNFAIGGGFKAQKLKYYNGDFPVDYILDENDVIVTMTDLSKEADTLGFSAKVPAWNGKRFLHNQRIGLVKLKTDEFDQNYLYWLMRTFSYQRFVANGATGATVKHTSPTKICQYRFTAPEDKTTQRKIASILSAYDDLIENNLKRVKLLEEKAFLRYKGIVREEKMDEFLIQDICETLGGGTPSTGDRRFWDEGEILWFSPTDLTKHHSIVLLDSDKKITELGLQKSSAKMLPPKTILMTSRASIGYFGLINKPASTNQGFINIIPFNENHRAYMLFDLKNRKEEVIGNANGSTFLEISKGQFRQMKIKLPKNENVLIEFENEFEVTFNFIENLLKQNTQLRAARDILLPKLMNGQIEV